MNPLAKEPNERIHRRFRALYPFSSHFLPLPGGRMHYVDEGQGEPVVLLHGNPSWSFMWRDLIRALAPDHRCVAPDHMGMGLSDKPPDSVYDYTLSRRVEDLGALLERLGLTRDLTLVLHDWGGMIGLAWALRTPEAVRRLVLLNTAAFPNPKGTRLPWQLHLARSPLGAFLVRGLNAFARGACRVGTAKKPMSSAIREAYLCPYGSWAERIAIQRFVQDIPLGPEDRSFAIVQRVSEGLSRLRGLPTLILWGERDLVFDSAFLSEWRRRFPQAESHAFPEAGHFVLEDEPEAVTSLVRGFLARHPARAPAGRGGGPAPGRGAP